MISFACPGCGKHIKVKDELVGKKGKCPGCGKPVIVPQGNDSPAVALAQPGKASAASLGCSASWYSANHPTVTGGFCLTKEIFWTRHLTDSGA